jgi:hypothetical protein
VQRLQSDVEIRLRAVQNKCPFRNLSHMPVKTAFPLP